jgi:branched-chain amino acid transport system substrate-binding protein
LECEETKTRTRADQAEEMTMRSKRLRLFGPLLLPALLALGLAAPAAQAQQPKEVKVGLIVPLSGLYARPGAVMRMGAEMAIERINAEGGVKALGGAKLKLVVLDSGDTTEFTLAVTEVTERAHLPVLTLSYSDLITQRGFKYIFQTSATSGSQAEQSLPVIMATAKGAGANPKTVAIVTDNTAASVSSVKPMRERLLKELGLKLVVDETFTPPLADATPLVQKIRAARPDLFFFLPTVISDAKLVLEKMNEFGMGKGKVPTISFGIAMFEPDMLKTMSPDLLEGMMGAVGSWGSKGHEAIIAELKKKYNEPWMTQNGVSTYADMLVIRDALEKAGKADREAVATALHTMDGGPSKYYPGGKIKFGPDGRREGASLTIIQWQHGVPVTIYPPDLAMAKANWPKN